MAIKITQFGDKITLDDIADKQDISSVEMPPSERAKFTLAGWVLSASALLMVTAWAIEVFYPLSVLDLDCPQTTPESCAEQIKEAFTYSTTAAEHIFELAKTWIPPVITLVLGYYFGRGDSSNNSS